MEVLLETSRLNFRELVPSDDINIYKLDSDPEVQRYVGNKPVQSLEECHAVIEYIREQYRTNGVGRMAAILKETGEFIGWAGLKLNHNVNGHEKYYDLGYRFMPKYWGKGYATEAAAAFVDYGFNVMKLLKINAYADARNTASHKVLQRAGLRLTEAFDDNGEPAVWFEIKNPNL